ncbi:zinc ribbon domain-containing protein [Rhodocaloribacter sp.]
MPHSPMTEKQKECPSCALPVDADAEECPYCGYEFPVQKPVVKLVAVLMVLLLLGWFAVGC